MPGSCRELPDGYNYPVFVMNNEMLALNNGSCHFQLQFTFRKFGNHISHVADRLDNVEVRISAENELTFVYRSNRVCFSVEEIDIGQEMDIQYIINSQIFANSLIGYERGPIVKWTLYADNDTQDWVEII